MNLFKTIKLVLDEQFAEIDEDVETRVVTVKAALKYLSAGYASLVIKNNLSYANPAVRFAYIFKYVTSHSDMTYQGIGQYSKALRSLFNRKIVQVSCIGGGPGSDLLGVLKYAEQVLKMEDSKLKQIRCYLIDGENAWADAWSDVDQKVGLKCSVSTFFLCMKVTEPSQWKLHSKYLAADLFTMVYFVSEIYAMREEAEPFFVNLLASMKLGACLLFVDNNDSRFKDWISGLADAAGLKLVSEDDGEKCMGYDEQKSDLGEYMDLFGSPKIRGNATFRVWRKI
jgi:hypothetical protein